PEFNKTFDVALHAGTLVAAIAYFRHEVVQLTRGFVEAVRRRAIETPNQRLSVAIAVGTVPAIIFGGLGSGFIDEHLGEPWMIAIQLIVFGALLLYADRLPQRKSLEGSSVKDGLYIGLAQVLALAPGTSRSGITITAARYLGLDRDSAARFSFLLLIPIVAGATVFKAGSAIHDGLPSGVAGPMVVGTLAAAISGYLAIAFLLRLVRTVSYAPFVYYRYAVGVAILLIIATGLRPATF
ncbi:MAG TPA: undecaprenyl-diphosphate phosphatase, partial [Solirubrobacterales bacterium]|nr:undecaprenyl-diphosphate phosphatase [Solirubrobacterales bacterium]